MRTSKEKLDSLNTKSIWMFTKQETDFDEIFKASKLFASISNPKTTNIETFFANNYKKFEISSYRHRMLITSQLYGLITKTPFFSRGSSYSNEKVTPVFNAFSGYPINSYEYNTFKTEQLLKIKFHAIIDSANNNIGYNIFPIIFIYQVLRNLREKYGINEITEDQLYTYVMTCKTYNELDEAVEFIKQNAPKTVFVDEYKSNCRMVTIIKKNIKLFIIKNSKISINPKFDDYFYDNFIKKYNIEELHKRLSDNSEYAKFLYHYQNFNINLLDEPKQQLETTETFIENQDAMPFENEDDDATYLKNVDGVDDKNINEDVFVNAYKQEPVFVNKLEDRMHLRKNPILGKIAIKKADYKCLNDNAHKTFISKKSNKQYMEAHHLIPVCYQKEMWEKYKVNIDCIENIVSLCPTCHKAFHYGSNQVKDEIIENMYKICARNYNEIGLNISLEEIKKLYKL